MKQIRLLADTTLTYTLTGNDRQADVSLGSDTALSFKNLETDEPNFTLKPGNFTIKTARLIGSGANGLQPGVNELAGTLNLAMTNGVDELEPVCLSLEDWNCDIKLGLGTGSGDLTGVLSFVLKAGSTVTCDDYNVQDAYIGQTISIWLELTLEVNDNV